MGVERMLNHPDELSSLFGAGGREDARRVQQEALARETRDDPLRDRGR